MESALQEIFVGLVLMVFGAMGTGFIWLIKRILKANRDLNEAHATLRLIMDRVGIRCEDKKKHLHLYMRQSSKRRK